MSPRMAIYTFEGPTELYVHPSLTSAEGYFEAIDVENDEYVFFGDDGTVIKPSVRNGHALLTLTEDKRPHELRERLRTYLTQSSLALDPALADDPVSLSTLLLDRERAHGKSGWLARLHRRFRAR